MRTPCFALSSFAAAVRRRREDRLRRAARRAPLRYDVARTERHHQRARTRIHRTWPRRHGLLDPRASDAALINGRHTTASNPALTSAFEQLFYHLEQWEPDVVSQHAFDAEAFALSHHIAAVHTLHLNPDDESVLDAVRNTRAPVVAVSHDSAKRWIAAGAANVHTIRNAVSDGFTPQLAPDPIALIAGRIAPEKGTATAIRVARRARLEPVIVGEVYDRGYFAREIVPLLSGVRVMSTLPRDRIRTLMTRAAVTVMPIEWDEAFGLVAAESQMSGCPVVGYARGALPEVVPHGVGGVLVPPGDEDALVEAIELARSLDRQAIRASALQRFDVDAMVDAYEELLAEAATGMIPTGVAA